MNWGIILVAVTVYLETATLVRLEEEHRWQASLRAFELRLPAGVDAEQTGRWIGTLAGMSGSPWWPLSIPRWWPLGIPRWPLILELLATDHGVRHVLLIPDQMVGHVLAQCR